MNLPGGPLIAEDLAQLAKSGISPELAQSALLRRVESIDGGALIGRNGSGDYAGLVFPYVWPGEEHIRECRLRRDRPELEQKPDGTFKERGKYLAPHGRANLLYFAPGTDPEWLTDPTLPVIVTEGEKKCLALFGLAWHGLGDVATCPRWLPIALPGVWNWRGTIGKAPGPDGDRRDVKGVIPDFDRITWKSQHGRSVVILFDRNVATNDSVAAARRELAKELSRRGAVVEYIDLPDLPDLNGVDDLIGLWGAEKSLNLMRTAARPWDTRRPAETGASRFARIEDLPRLQDIGAAEIEWDVEGLIPRATVSLLTGEPGCGKSSLASALAFAVSKGRNFIGRPTIRRPVLILDAENPSIAVIERFQRLKIATDDEFRVWGQWTGEDPPTAGGAIVLEWVARCEPKPLIVVDSFIRFHPGAENSATETQQHMSMYRKLTAAGASVLLLHHIGKSETSQDYRGSSDIKASVDIAFKLTNLGDGSRLSLLELRAFKQRISVTPHLHLRYEDGEFSSDDRGALKTVTERLVELLKANPGITTADFEKQAVAQNLGRGRARDFLTGGIESRTIHVDREGNRRMHSWRGPKDGDSWAS